jgi:phospholipase/carboxylesterase
VCAYAVGRDDAWYMARMRIARMSGLEVKIAGGSDQSGGGSGPVVILLHGYGATGDDLVPLARVLNVPPEVRFVFPAAPLALPELAVYGGRAWWPIDIEAMQLAAAQGQARERALEVPAGLAEARAALNALLAEVQRELGVAGEHIVLGGFSQGAMLACDVALHSDTPLAGLVLLSTTLLNQAEWQPLMAARKGLSVLQTHGLHDPLLPLAQARALRDLLRAAGVPVRWLEFQGAHELPEPVLRELSAFITQHA